MGVDLRTGRITYAYQRFLIYPANTSSKEILEHTAKAKGSFRGVGAGQELYRKDNNGNVVRTSIKTDMFQTNDRISINVDDIIYNQYEKDIYIITNYEVIDNNQEQEFSTRNSRTTNIYVRKSGRNGK